MQCFRQGYDHSTCQLGLITSHAIGLAGCSAASVLQDRVAKLQELYMRDLDQSKAITVHEGIQQSSLLQLATPQMLALSQPPADFRLEEDARSTRIVPALHEIEGLSRERKILKDQVNNIPTAAATFWECATAGKPADQDLSLAAIFGIVSAEDLVRLTQSLPAISKHCATPIMLVRTQHLQASSQYACFAAEHAWLVVTSIFSI